MGISLRRFIPILTVLLLLAANIALLCVLLSPHQTHNLKVSFLNVGQGDSILIQSPTGVKMLIDGGPDHSVLRELSKELSPTDRTIDLVVETHPDADHITGLIDVLDRYSVKNFLDSNIGDTTATAKRLEEAVATEPGAVHLLARRGTRIHLGGGAYADVLYPYTDVSHIEETNDGSVVLHVVYGVTSFMLTGDLPSFYEDKLVTLDKGDGELPSTVLKAGHHGSKSSTDDEWLAAVHPQTVVISAGEHNKYGHPAAETLARITKEGGTIVSTMDLGTIDFESDGKTVKKP